MRTRHLILSLSLLCLATPARAELVFFTTGRSLSVKAHRVEGESLILTLRSGVEVVCDPATIAQVVPDETPYPEPEPIRLKPDSASVGLQPDPTQTWGPPSGGPIQLRPDSTGVDTRYADIIDRAAARHGVDARLVRAVIEVESGYQPRARSSKGAMGLMQLMPATARQYAVTNPYDPAANIEAGTRHLKSLLARFPPALALAAYNAGHVAVERFQGIPPYAETRKYVSRILQLIDRS